MNDQRPDSQDPVDPFDATGHIEDWEHLALDLLEGILPADARAALDSHLEQCPRCRESLDEQRRVREMLAAAPLVEPPVRIARNVLRAERPHSELTSLGERVRAARRRSMMRTWLPAAAVLLITIGAVATYQQPFLRGGESDMALKNGTTAATEPLDETAMSAAPVDGTTPATSAASESAATDHTTTTASAPAGDARLTVSAYLDALPPSSGEDMPVVLLAMPASGVDSSSVDTVQAVTGLNPLQPTDSTDGLVTFAARADRSEIDALIALLGDPGLAVFRFVDRASEMAPGVRSAVGDDPSAFPVIKATPGENRGFEPMGYSSDLGDLDRGSYVLVVITSGDGG